MDSNLDKKNNFDEEAIKNVREKMLPEKHVKMLSSFFKAVGEENRVRIIFALLQQEMCVNDLSAALEISSSLVSHQLKILRVEGLVKARKDGKNSYYSIDDEHVALILEQSLNHIDHRLHDHKEI